MLKSMGMPVESITKPHQAARSLLLRFSFEMKLMVQTHETVPEGGRNFPYVLVDPDHIFPVPEIKCSLALVSQAQPCLSNLFLPFRWTKGDGQKCQGGHC